jgi:hypothetical protein
VGGMVAPHGSAVWAGLGRCHGEWSSLTSHINKLRSRLERVCLNTIVFPFQIINFNFLPF